MSEAPPTTYYGYVPNLGVCIAFIVLFALSTSAHIVQGAMRKQWYMFLTAVFCGVLEILGWASRLWSHYEPLNFLPFQLQIVFTILGPTPLLAANFVIFGRIVQRLGTQFSWLGPWLYTIVFCSCDLIALVVQAVGGALAATGDSLAEANKGANIMLGGIVFQLVVIIVYGALASDYLIRYFKAQPLKHKLSSADSPQRGQYTKGIKLMVFALCFNTLCLLTRAIYRTIELTDGWTGRIIHTEIYFNWLDGAMITLAIYTFNFAHPGWLLSEPDAIHSGDISNSTLALKERPQEDSC